MVGKRIRQLETAKVIDLDKTYLPVDSLNSTEAKKISARDLLLTKVSGVKSFNNRIGIVEPQIGDYDKAMIGLSDVENLSPADLPISDAVQTKLDDIYDTIAVAKEQHEYIGAIEYQSISDIQSDLSKYVTSKVNRNSRNGDLVNVLSVPFQGAFKTQQWRYDGSWWSIYIDNVGSIAAATKTSIGYVSIGDGVEVTSEGKISSPLAVSALQPTSAIDDTVVSFTEASTKENINSGEKTSVLLGKIRKWFSLLKSAAFMDSTDFATKAQGTKADTAIQSATIGGVVVTKSDTQLRLPSYPDTLPADGGHSETADKWQAPITISLSGDIIGSVAIDGSKDVTINTTGAIKVEGSTINGNIKINGVEDVVYVHPSTHPASVIVQDTNNRFVKDTEKEAWNAKVGASVATTTANGLMASADKVKLNEIAVKANLYVHPATHPASVVVQDANNRFMTDVERTKLNGVATSANNYAHPATHPASVVVQDANNRFVRDTEKATWNVGAVYNVTHARAGIIHTLTGTIPTSGFVSVRFKATANFVEKDTFKVGTVVYTAKPVGEELALPDKAFVSGDIVQFELDIAAKKINFKMGGSGRTSLSPPLEGIWRYNGHSSARYNPGIVGMALDTQGNVYAADSDDKVITISPSGTFIRSYNAKQSLVQSITVDIQGDVYTGRVNGALIKMSPFGTLIWSYTGRDYDPVQSIAVDTQGNVYSGGYDGTVRKISPSGTLIWSYTGSTAIVSDIAVDTQGNVYTDDKVFGSTIYTVRKFRQTL